MSKVTSDSLQTVNKSVGFTMSQFIYDTLFALNSAVGQYLSRGEIELSILIMLSPRSSLTAVVKTQPCCTVYGTVMLTCPLKERYFGLKQLCVSVTV